MLGDYGVTSFTDEPPQSGGAGGGDLIGGLLYLGGSIYQGEVAKRNTDKSIKANKELAQYAYSSDVEMWNRMNQYNSPEAQMQRLRAAGLNPNMLYGSGSSAASGNASTMPRYNAPTVQYNYKPMVDIPAVLGLYQDFKMKQAQTDNVKAQTENIRARTASEPFRRDVLNYDAREKNFRLTNMLPYQSSILQDESRTAPLKTAEAWERVKLMGQEGQLKELQRLRDTQGLKMMDVDMERKQADLLFAQYRNQWMQMGITNSDNVLLRVFVRMMASMNFEDFGK